MKNFINKIKNKKGFAVLFTVLISAIVLAIALGITSISYQEVVLSSSAKEGNIAFFAADSGAECVLYWDTKGAFDQAPQTPVCAGANGVINFVDQNPLFSFDIDLSANSCAKITVDKNAFVDPAQTIIGTKIESLGYNVSCATLAAQQQNQTPNPRLVERAIRIIYENSASGTGGSCNNDTFCDAGEDATSCPADCGGGGGGGGGGGPPAE